MERPKIIIAMRSIFTCALLSLLCLGGVLLLRQGGLKMVRTRDFTTAFPARMKFVELNGGYYRGIGRRFCNTVYRTSEGTMLSGYARRSVSQVAEAATEFSKWLAKQGISYMFVQTPAKIDLRGSLAPPSSVFESGANTTSDEFLAYLQRAEVWTVDLRAEFTDGANDLLRYFYRTDHHWNNDAVFKAFGILSGHLAKWKGVDSKLVEEYAGSSSWKREIRPNCFLGSKGKRTGWLFSGFDDMTIYTPRFSTKMSIDVPDKKVHKVGSFRQTNMWRAQTICGKRGKSYSTDAYSALYVGGIYPFVRHRNLEAPIDAKVLIIGDSYVRPLEAFLSTTVREIVVIDPRRIDRSQTLVQHVKRENPDIVLQIQNPSAFGADVIGGERTHRPVMFDYGLPCVDGK